MRLPLETTVVYGKQRLYPSSDEIVMIVGVPNNTVEQHAFPASAANRFIVSDDTTDALSGGGETPGLEKVRIEGLRDGFVAESSDFTLTGTAEVNIGSWLRINRMIALKADGVTQGFGQPKPNGNISLLNGSGGSAMHALYTGDVYSSVAIYTVPAGKSLVIIRAFMEDDAGNGALLLGWKKAPGESFAPFHFDAVNNNAARNLETPFPIIIPEKTDIRFTGVGARAKWRGVLIPSSGTD